MSTGSRHEGGIGWHGHLYNEGQGPRLLALHGFTGSGADFAPLALALVQEMVAPDLPGHGRSDAPSDAAPYELEPVLQGLADWVGEDPILLGYSMGGRLALHLTLAHPDRIRALVLVGSTPGIRDPEVRAARRVLDTALAVRIETEGVEWFSAHWASLPIIATQDRIAAPFREQMQQRRAQNRAHGLAHTLRGIGQGVLSPCWDQLQTLRCPVLLLTGDGDPTYRDIAEQMMPQLEQAEHIVIRGAGHCAHLEQPERTAAAIGGFLKRAGVG